MVTKLKIENTEFTRISNSSVKPDTRNRVLLPQSLVREGITYRIYTNSVGQIILIPQVTIPEYEAWLFENQDVRALVKQGLSDVDEGRVSKINLDTL